MSQKSQESETLLLVESSKNGDTAQAADGDRCDSVQPPDWAEQVLGTSLPGTVHKCDHYLLMTRRLHRCTQSACLVTLNIGLSCNKLTLSITSNAPMSVDVLASFVLDATVSAHHLRNNDSATG